MPLLEKTGKMKRQNKDRDRGELTDRFVCVSRLFAQLRDRTPTAKLLFEKLLTMDLVLHRRSVNKPQV